MDAKDMLRYLLKDGLTEEAIASFVKVHQSTISRVLSGKIPDPKSSLTHAIKMLFEQNAHSADP